MIKHYNCQKKIIILNSYEINKISFKLYKAQNDRINGKFLKTLSYWETLTYIYSDQCINRQKLSKNTEYVNTTIKFDLRNVYVILHTMTKEYMFSTRT